MAGRKRLVIDWTELDKLCEMQCTIREIAHWFKCDPMTIEHKCQKEQHMNFQDYFQKHAASGQVSLRRSLFQLALGGQVIKKVTKILKNGTQYDEVGYAIADTGAAIFLAKNYLGMSDKQEIVYSDKTARAEDLSDAELAKIITSRRSKRAAEAAESTG